MCFSKSIPPKPLFAKEMKGLFGQKRGPACPHRIFRKHHKMLLIRHFLALAVRKKFLDKKD